MYLMNSWDAKPFLCIFRQGSDRVDKSVVVSSGSVFDVQVDTARTMNDEGHKTKSVPHTHLELHCRMAGYLHLRIPWVKSSEYWFNPPTATYGLHISFIQWWSWKENTHPRTYSKSSPRNWKPANRCWNPRSPSHHPSSTSRFYPSPDISECPMPWKSSPPNLFLQSFLILGCRSKNMPNRLWLDLTLSCPSREKRLTLEKSMTGSPPFPKNT